MNNKALRQIKLTLALVTACLLALSAITLVYKIAVNDDYVTGLPTWLNFLVTVCLLALSVTFARRIDDEPPTEQ